MFPPKDKIQNKIEPLMSKHRCNIGGNQREIRGKIVTEPECTEPAKWKYKQKETDIWAYRCDTHKQWLDVNLIIERV